MIDYSKYSKFSREEIDFIIAETTTYVDGITGALIVGREFTAIEYERKALFDFLRSNREEDIQIVLKSKTTTDKVEIVLEEYPSVFQSLWKELHRRGVDPRLPDRKRGGQEGFKPSASYQWWARKIYSTYIAKYPSKIRAYNFIAEVYTIAGHPMTAGNAKKLVDLQNWVK